MKDAYEMAKTQCMECNLQYAIDELELTDEQMEFLSNLDADHSEDCENVESEWSAREPGNVY